MNNNKTKVSADLKKNQLQITLVGVVSTDVLKEVFTEIRFCVADLKPGFNVITDMTQCRVGHLSGLGIFAKIKDYLSAKGVGTVIRVVNKQQLIFNQISRVIDKINNYSLIYAATLDEAKAKLAEMESVAGKSTTP